ncbi:MAG: FAD-binding protein, partial [Clostridia bacterium]|nr:FAD-binding protein [Clostridia bacterium]
MMKNISRRDFLKGGAAMSLLTAMGGASLAAAEESYTYADTIKWDAQYDVVVLGMGFAGMNAAIAAADAGASVLLAEKMEEGKAGGNSKVCGQLFAYGNRDYEATKAYYQDLAGGRNVPDAMFEVLVNGVTNMWDTLKNKLFDGNDAEFVDWSPHPVVKYMSPEYPEFSGSNKISLCTTHGGLGDSFLFGKTKEAVIARKDNIDVWYESPALELIQEPMTGTVIGVSISRKGETRKVRALNGVCVCTGGFENNKEMLLQYINLLNTVPCGGLYNTGDGILMCQRAGAQLWHMAVYEGIGGIGSCTYNVPDGRNAVIVANCRQNTENTGATIIVGTDGYRFMNESEVPRHGHVYENGIWENPRYTNKMFLIYDKTQYELTISEGNLAEEWQNTAIPAASIEELAEKTGCKPEVLKDTIESFNRFAENGKDDKHHREAHTMRAFDGEMYYAIPLKTSILNTQGGPRRNENAEILNTHGDPIPHLYSAGEMGGITACMYQGGTNIAECFIFGEIAGKNAAAAKEALPVYTAAAKVESTPLTLGMDTDIGASKVYDVAEGQYIGTGTGMSGITVRVTMTDGKISVVEVLEQNETVGIGDKAIAELPGKFVGCATAEEIDAVDGVSGATVTSKALKEAVKAALAQVK